MANNRLDFIRKYKENAETIDEAREAIAEQKRQAESKRLADAIHGLKDRIDELLDTANACLENGVDVSPFDVNWRQVDEICFFMSADTGMTVDRMGICEHRSFVLGQDFWTDGVSVEGDNRLAQAFLDGFDTFETEFYAHVDMELDKQQEELLEVNALLKGAYGAAAEYNAGLSRETAGMVMDGPDYGL